MDKKGQETTRRCQNILPTKSSNLEQAWKKNKTQKSDVTKKISKFLHRESQCERSLEMKLTWMLRKLSILWQPKPSHSAVATTAAFELL